MHIVWNCITLPSEVMGGALGKLSISFHGNNASTALFRSPSAARSIRSQQGMQGSFYCSKPEIIYFVTKAKLFHKGQYRSHYAEQ